MLPMPWPSRSVISKPSTRVGVLIFPQSSAPGPHLVCRLLLEKKNDAQHARRCRASNRHDETLPFSSDAALFDARSWPRLWLSGIFVSNFFFRHDGQTG